MAAGGAVVEGAGVIDVLEQHLILEHLRATTQFSGTIYFALARSSVASADCRYEQHIYIKPGFTPRLYGSSVRLRYSKLEFLISRLTFCHSEAFFFRLCTR